jgi:hypothetical protein
VQGAQSLASVLTSNADTSWYFATNGTAWETGLLTRTSATVYARTTIFASSNAGSAVNFSTGLVDIALDLPASIVETLNLTEITVASATTTDIGAAAVQGAKIVVSGSVTITGLGTGANKLRYLRFSGAPLLTHNGTSLILPGAANIQAAAGDTAIVLSDASGNWRCHSYMFAAVAPFDRRAPGAIGGTTPASGAFTTLNASDTTEAGAGTGSVVTLGGISAAKAIRSESTTVSTSRTTGSGIFGGGIGVSGVVSATNFKAYGTPSAAAPHLDWTGGATISVANGASSTETIATQSNYFVLTLLETTADGDGTIFYGGFAGGVWFGTKGTHWDVTNNTSPAAGKYSIGSDGSGNYHIYNNAGGTSPRNFRCKVEKMG